MKERREVQRAASGADTVRLSMQLDCEMTEKPLGIACERCGNLMEVHRTTPRPGFILRRRECSCGHRVTTTERVVNESKDSAPDIGDGHRQFSIRHLEELLQLVRDSDATNEIHRV